MLAAEIAQLNGSLALGNGPLPTEQHPPEIALQPQTLLEQLSLTALGSMAKAHRSLPFTNGTMAARFVRNLPPVARAQLPPALLVNKRARNALLVLWLRVGTIVANALLLPHTCTLEAVLRAPVALAFRPTPVAVPVSRTAMLESVLFVLGAQAIRSWDSWREKVSATIPLAALSSPVVHTKLESATFLCRLFRTSKLQLNGPFTLLSQGQQVQQLALQLVVTLPVLLLVMNRELP